MFGEMLGYFFARGGYISNLILCFNNQATKHIYEKSPNLLLLDVFFNFCEGKVKFTHLWTVKITIKVIIIVILTNPQY